MLERERCERLNIPYEDLGDLVIEEQLNIQKTNKEHDESLSNQLSLHVIGPLIDNYEQTIALLSKEIKQTKFQFKQQMEDCRIIVNENDDLRQQLTIKNRELLRITKERAEHASDAAGLDGEDAITGEDGKSSTD